MQPIEYEYIAAGDAHGMKGIMRWLLAAPPDIRTNIDLQEQQGTKIIVRPLDDIIERTAFMLGKETDRDVTGRVFVWPLTSTMIGFNGLDEYGRREIVVDSWDGVKLDYNYALPERFGNEGTIKLRVTANLEIFGQDGEYVFSEIIADRINQGLQKEDNGTIILDLSKEEDRTIFRALLADVEPGNPASGSTMRSAGGDGRIELVYIPKEATSEEEYVKEAIVVRFPLPEDARITVDIDGDFQIDGDDDAVKRRQTFHFWCDPDDRMEPVSPPNEYVVYPTTLNPHYEEERRSRQLAMLDYTLMRLVVGQEAHDLYDRFEIRVSNKSGSAMSFHMGNAVADGFDDGSHRCYLFDPVYAPRAEENFRPRVLDSNHPFVIDKREIEADHFHNILFSPLVEGECSLRLFGIRKGFAPRMLDWLNCSIDHISRRLVVYSSRNGDGTSQPVEQYPWEGTVCVENPDPEPRNDVEEHVYPTPSSPITYHDFKGRREYYGDLNLNRPEVVFFVHGYSATADGTFADDKHMFKKLFWGGFVGNFVSFHWEGDYPSASDFMDKLFFSTDQWQAFMTSPAAVGALRNIRHRYTGVGMSAPRIKLLVHSLGNQVMSDAMRYCELRGESIPFDEYIMYEAAVWANSFYPRPAAVADRIVFQEHSWEFLYRDGIEQFTIGQGGIMHNLHNEHDGALWVMKNLDDLSQGGGTDGIPRFPRSLARDIQAKPPDGSTTDPGGPYEAMGKDTHDAIPGIPVAAFDANSYLNTHGLGWNGFAVNAHFYLANRPLWAILPILQTTGVVP
jgi:hypothetical protein